MLDKTEKTRDELEKEIKELTEQKRKDWVNFIKTLKDDPNGVVTNEVLSTVIDYIANDIEGIGQAAMYAASNIQALGHNQQQIIHALQMIGQGNPSVNKTKGGIILPNG